jgi:RNA recognition motif-containing protein
MIKETENFLDSSIIIKNISPRVTCDGLSSEFSKFGKIQMIDVNIKKKLAFVVKFVFIVRNIS